MRSFNKLFGIVLLLLAIVSCNPLARDPFWNGGKEIFDTQQVYASERFPNVVVAMDGTVVTSWGDNSHQVRRSDDGGASWGPLITVSMYNWWQNAYPGMGIHGGGAIVDEHSGDIIVFVEAFRPPPAPLTVFRSSDHGKTWKETEVVIHPDSKGDYPYMHMQEAGITLTHGKYAGRLIRTSRVVAGSNPNSEEPSIPHANAIYSDDGGKTWYTSEPFPAFGTNEAAIAELSDGSIYFNSRRTSASDGLDPRWRHAAWSYDGGHTWVDLQVSDVLPDGPQHHNYGMMGGLVRLTIDGHDILLFSNADVPEALYEPVSWELRTTRRERGTVWASFDGGRTWPVKRLIDPGLFGYSSLAVGRPNTPSEGMIYCLYESKSDPDSRFDAGNMARFNLAWVLAGKDWRQYLP